MVLGAPAPSLLGGGAVSAAHVGVMITFEAQAGRSYTVQYREGLTLPWRNLAQVPVRDVTRIERILDPEPNAQSRFYRVVTPAVE